MTYESNETKRFSYYSGRYLTESEYAAELEMRKYNKQKNKDRYRMSREQWSSEYEKGGHI